MKKIFVSVFFAFLFCSCAFADVTTQTAQQPVQYVSFSDCYKTYGKPAEPVFYLVLAAISKNNYIIEEVQSKNGLILFKANNKEFFVNITQIDSQTTMVKIVPADNSYSFEYSYIDNIFKSVVADLNSPIYKIN